MQLSRVLLVAATLLATLLALAQGRVVDLAQGNMFDEGISAGPWFVMFCRHNCAHCEKVKHRWEDLAQSYSGETQIGTVDIAATPKGRELAARFKKGAVYTFEGDRNKVESFIEFIDAGYHPLYRFTASPKWAALIWVPVAILSVALCFVARASAYDGVEDFGRHIGAYTPPPPVEDAEEPLVRPRRKNVRN
ncbi:uncharacterized protein ACA1_183210 [Acanthamoeba castellanii str. Neff]|uniref:Thioredoxin domain-containing protein n=1 Tax=Acanthamoeba castellanii (strain ATCC 30010 / Neff) TaxID=1257118 RepID=L8H812_ACACF|nr:uncharacterized protein ACA1_183210 [Acanthamoeba castellanii str. Neff]ELR21387.1 hypothetical protein ACA1_183210 [Acanthamoeba castellanii str. Neff]